ncbi:MAG: NAD-dependent epimerase/dehydratase family protein [Thioploca sp.]|nr:NAD-dependent epimerase/dehydratase family protein [Thioploca sp.]
MKEKRILITGANGFLGKHVIQAYQDATIFANPSSYYLFTPSSKQFDLTRLDMTEAMFLKYSPNIILHMAAVCGGIGANKDRPADFIHLNTQMTSNIFECALRYDIEYMYTLGSVCSYPCDCPVPFKEDDIWNGFPEVTNAPYGIAKRHQLMMQEAFRTQYGLKGCHFIPVNMYGEQDDFDLKTSHVIPALIRKFVEAKEKGEKEVEVWGTGEATREFLYVGDCAEALVKALINLFDYDKPINLGTGADISIKDLADKIRTLTGFTGSIIYRGDKVINGQPKRRLDVSRAKDVLKWEAKINLDDGLKKL